MKKQSFLFLFFILFIMSCKKEQQIIYPVQNTKENNIPDGITKFSLSIHILSDDNSQNAREDGLSGATVTINSNEGLITKTVVSSGIVVFTDLSEGEISIFVQGQKGFANYNTSVFLKRTQNTSDDNSSDTEQYQLVRKEIFLPKLNTALKGIVMADFDQDFDFAQTDQGNFLPNISIVVKTLDKGIEPNTFITTTDEEGNYSFSNLPEGEVEIHFGDFSLPSRLDPTTRKVYSGNAKATLTAGITIDAGYTMLNEK